MDRSAIEALLSLTDSPALAVREGRIVLATPEAEALGLRVGVEAPAVFAEAEGTERLWTLGKRNLLLRTARLEDWLICVLRPQPALVAAPNEQTMIRTAGNIRIALQDLTLAMNGLADLPALAAEPYSGRAAALMQSLYRLRRMAGSLETFAKLRAGSYSLNRQTCNLKANTALLCGEFAELLQQIGIHLKAELPARDTVGIVDWPLTAAMLRELLANAAANTADGILRLSLHPMGADSFRFDLVNRPRTPLGEIPFQSHLDAEEQMRAATGLGLSLVSAGAACHGGSFLLSRDSDGLVTASLRIRAGAEPDSSFRARLDHDSGSDLALEALSALLPRELFRLEDLLF